jgi:hypothetical protein
MKVYGIIFDGGDGSASIRWFNEEDCNYILSDDYEEFDYVQMNEGYPSVVLNFPDGINPSDIGITLSEV